MASTPDKDSVIEKVRKLINLAASTNQKEAERAAYKACALIRANGLDVCDPDVIDGIYQSQAQLEDQVRRLEAGKEADHGWSTPRSTQMNPGGFGGYPTYFHTSTVAPPPPQPPPMNRPVNLKGGAKFDANCLQCGGRIRTGDPVLWQRGVGCWHSMTACYQDWLASKAAASAFDPYAAP